LVGIPHELQEDCVYEGYFLPKGSWVHPMEWSLSRDPEVYPEPEKFNPDRWLSPGYPTYKEPLTQFPTLHGHHQFGFGRRVCQGVNIVQTQTFCLLAAVAWGFDIKRKKDKLGQEIPIPPADYHPLLITKPNPFQFDLVPRSETRRQEILAVFEQAREEDQFLQKGE
jgi:cytochrome P450